MEHVSITLSKMFIKELNEILPFHSARAITVDHKNIPKDEMQFIIISECKACGKEHTIKKHGKHKSGTYIADGTLIQVFKIGYATLWEWADFLHFEPRKQHMSIWSESDMQYFAQKWLTEFLRGNIIDYRPPFYPSFGDGQFVCYECTTKVEDAIELLATVYGEDSIKNFL